MKTWLRQAYLGLAWLFVAGVVIQFFLIGLGLFGDPAFRKTHALFGFTFLHLTSLLLPILAYFARLPRRTVGLSLLLFVVVTVQVALPGLATTSPYIAALHPVNALLVFGLGLMLAQRARVYEQVPAETTLPSRAVEATEAA